MAVVVRNVRVLAIGQLIEAKEGKKLAEGNTATLELNPQQAEELAGANARGENLADSAEHRGHEGRGRDDQHSSEGYALRRKVACKRRC